MDLSRENIDPLALDDDKEIETVQTASVWEHEALSQIPIKVLRGHTDVVSSCHFCYGDTRILTSSHDKTVIFWDAEKGAQVQLFEGGHKSAITGCSFIPEKNRVITASWDKTLNAWDVETGKILWTSALGGLLTSCSVSADGKFVASSSDSENALYVSCADTGERLFYMKDHHKSTVTSCRFDPQSEHVASVSADKTIKLWDLCSHRTTLTINSTHTNVISNCCFTSNGRHICTASWDRTLQLWDIKEGRLCLRVGMEISKGHTGSVSSCAFSNDDSFLVSGAYDKTVAVWDMKSQCRTLVLKGHLDWVTDVDVSADKNWVASSSKDSTVRLWNVENSEQIPAVIETRRAQRMGFQILKCEECGKPFSISRTDDSDIIKCVFCRLKAPNRSLPAPPCL
ncbi:WD repeat-containing protein 88-like [Chanos chanos]|uniref:WD repeat-containing protein 88-like n=1 Tax=Chanos chanos TaxID=29144 RepID=A0A6J2X0E1_CHACN|nr:WD repeat-containing protein 88 [Chanos chanos]